MWSRLCRVPVARRASRACEEHLTRLWRAVGTSAPSMDKTVAKLESNPYYDKYASRIAELQRAAPEEFQRRVQAVSPVKRQAAAPEPPQPDGDVGRYAAVLRPKEPRAAPAAVRDRRLDDIFKTELVADKEAEEISTIWEQYHLSQPVVAAVLPLAAHERAMECAARHPVFVVPLPRDHGYEFFLLQIANNSVHFTPLLAYQVHAENAPECLTVTHYTDLSSKGIVLMRGEYDKSVLTAVEARCLANQFQLYYAGSDPGRLSLLDTFTNHPDSFRHLDLVQNLESITLDPPPRVTATKQSNPTT